MQPLVFCLCCLLTQPPVETGKLTLSASKERPFAGELIDITLTIEAFTRTGLELRIPWQFQEPGWQPKHDEWMAMYSQNVPNSIPVLYQGKTLHVPRVKLGQHQLRWKYRVPIRVENDSIVFGAVSLGTTLSQGLSIEVRPLPVMLPSPHEWYLGVGPFQVTARWQQPKVALGEETTLELAISGAGDVAAINSPKLSELPGWDASKVLLETAPSVLQKDQRLFRIKVRPRQQQLALSNLKVRFFSPEQERWLTQPVVIPPLSIASAKGALNVPPGSSVDDARSHLPHLLEKSLDQHELGRRYTGWIRWVIAIPFLILLALAAHYGYVRWLSFTMTPAKRWQQAARAARVDKQQRELTPTRAYALLQRFLQAGRQYRGSADHEALLQAVKGLPLEQQLDQLLRALQHWQFGPLPMQPATIDRMFDQLLYDAEAITC